MSSQAHQLRSHVRTHNALIDDIGTANVAVTHVYLNVEREVRTTGKLLHPEDLLEHVDDLEDLLRGIRALIFEARRVSARAADSGIPPNSNTRTA